MLSEASRLLAASLDYETTLATVARLSMPALGAWCIVDLLLDDGAMRRLAVVHPDPVMQALARKLESGWPPERDDPFGLPVMMRTRRSTVMSPLPEELLEAAAGSAKRLRVLKALGMGSMMMVPMIARGVVLGAITFISAKTGHQYTSENLSLAEDLASLSAMAIDRAHLHRRAGKRSDLGAALASARRARAAAERAVTAAHVAQGRAEMARKTAETANRVKGEFLATMSHELRTPLNAIAGFAELLALGIHGELGEKQQDYVRRIQQSEQHLLELINNVLQYAQVEAGRLPYEMTSVSLPAALAYVEDMIGPQFASAGLALSCQCTEPIHARADREKLQQILLNLLSNALKFTPPGGAVSVGCERNTDSVSIRVVDSGIGIPADRLDVIFDPFVRVDHRLTRTTAGTGLGLAISRDMARAMGADLTVESTLGIGSTFILALPVGEEDAVRPVSAAGRESSGGAL
ncbi:MAG: GAF domain-containing sensor histidine kinase [Gemmatimonadota bacterium]|nr:GAF domain-containing sensor histidine kinase [Gemmatimonadota bacterium]